MKTIKILTLTVLLLFTAYMHGYANKQETLKKQAIEKLNKDIRKLFKGVSFNEVMCGEKECKISVFFKVNDNGIVELYHINGKNSKLVDYSKKTISNNELKADHSILNEEVYWINIVFKNNDFTLN